MNNITEKTNTYMPQDEKILNSSNSDIKIIEKGVVFYQNKYWITLNLFKKIAETRYINIHYHVRNLDSKHFIKCDDPEIYVPRGASLFVYMIDLDGCMDIINEIKLTNFIRSKSYAKSAVISYFDKLKGAQNSFYNTFIDVSLGSENNNLNYYTDCSDLIVGLNRLLQKNEFIEKTSELDEITIKLKLDKSLVNRKKL